MAYKFLSTILGIDANFTGNVGVGTTTPSYKLDVNGDTRLQGTLTGVTQYLSTGAAATSHYLEFLSTSSTNSYLNLRRLGGANGTYAYYLNNGTAYFSVDNGSGETRLYAGNGGYYLTFYSNNVEAMRIPSATRNVLIGTTTDAGYKLDVNGTARVITSLQVGNFTPGVAASASTIFTNGRISASGGITFYNPAAGDNQETGFKAGGNGVAIYVGNATVGSFGGPGGATSPNLNLTSGFNPNSGSSDKTLLLINPTYQTSGTYTGGIIGFYYNPTLTSITGTAYHRAIQTVTGDVIFGSTSGNVGIGTATLGTATELTLGGSQTASSAIARGGLINTTLVASANNDVLAALDVAPTFTNGAFTGVSNWGLRMFNSFRFQTDSDLAQGIYWKPANDGTTLRIYGSSYSGGVGYLQLNVQAGSDGLSVNGNSRSLSINAALTSIALNLSNIIFNTHGTGEAMRIVNATKNLLIGTTTDAGYKLDVLGTIRAYNTSNGQSTIRIDTNGTSDMAAQLVFMQNSPNWSSQIGTHTSGGGVNYGLQFRSQASVVNMVMNRDGSNYFGGTFALASARVHIKGSGSTSATSSFLVQNSSSTELFRVRDDGNVGIGITSPSYLLDVNGTVRTKNDFLNLDNSSNVRFKITDNTATGNVYTFLSRFDNTKDIFHVIFPSGTLTSSNVNWNFGMKGGANTFSIASYNGTSVSERILIYNNGNVGIGTTTDAGYKLDVVGTARVSGTTTLSTLAGSGTRMVVADATGVLSTQAIPSVPTRSYGAWQEDITQTAASSNTGYGVKFSTPDISGYGVNVINDPFGDATYIEMVNNGVYNIQFSLQLQNTAGQIEDVTIWLRKNGNTTADDIPATAGFVSVPNSHGGVPGTIIAAWNYFVEAAAGDFYQLVWSTTDHTRVSIEFYPAGSPPPSAASAILTVNQVN